MYRVDVLPGMELRDTKTRHVHLVLALEPGPEIIGGWVLVKSRLFDGFLERDEVVRFPTRTVKRFLELGAWVRITTTESEALSDGLHALLEGQTQRR